MSEVLSTLSLNHPGVDTETFASVFWLNVIKDQVNIAGTNGSATTSILVNAFSVSPVPLPGAMPLFAPGLRA